MNLRNLFFTSLFSFAVSLLLLNGFKSLLEIVGHISPATNKISDYELFDFYLAYAHPNLTELRIVIVDCTKDSRDDIARKINTIEKHRPLVIGLDVLFSKPAPLKENERLIHVIDSNKQNIVLAYTTYTPFYHQLAASGNNYHKGFIELEDVELIQRDFTPYRKNNHLQIDTFFAVNVANIAHKADSSLKGYALRDIDAKPLINFRKGFYGKPRYRVVYGLGDTSVFRNKIVLLGGVDTTLKEDMHFSPLNGHINRIHADMFGIEQLAQTVSTIIHNDYIKVMPPVFKLVLLFFFCVMIIALNEWIGRRFEKFEGQIMAGIFTLITLALLALSVICMDLFNVKMEPVDYLTTMLLVLAIYPKFPLFYNLVSKGAGIIIKGHDKQKRHV